MAVKTGTGAGGLLSAGSSWVGGVPPVSGTDTLSIPAGCTITQDVDFIAGSSTGAVGHALIIAGASGNHGKFRTQAGFTLSLRGFNSTNTPLNTSAFGELDQSLGGTLIFDVPTTIFCTLNGIWTSLPAGGVRPAIKIADGSAGSTNRMNWATQITNKTLGATTASWFDSQANQMCVYLGQVAISNAAGSGLGSFGDSSLSFGTIVPAGGLATEVASWTLVNSAGKYWVDYQNGYVIFYEAAATLWSMQATYKYLSLTGAVAFNIAANANGNQVQIDNTDMQCLGTVNTGTTDYLFYLKNKFKTGTERDARISNCNFTYCRKIIGLDNVNGQVGNLMNFQGNKAYGTDGDIYGTFIGVFRASNSYCSFAGSSYKGSSACGVINTNASTVITQANMDFGDMAIWAPQVLGEGGAVPGLTLWSGSSAVGGFWLGTGSSGDFRQIEDFSGATGNPAVMDGVVTYHAMRGANLGQYSTIKNCIFGKQYHHCINGPTSQSDIRLPEVTITGNIRLDSLLAGGLIELGYNRRQWFDNSTVAHNTDVRSSTGFPLGDIFDQSGPNMTTKLTHASNLAYKDQVGFQRSAGFTSAIYPQHFTLADYQAAFGSTSQDLLGWNRFAAFTGLVNVTGVSLNNPTLAGPLSGKSLAFVVNSATDRTLAWDGGTAVQIVQTSGTLTAVGANSTFSGTLTDSGKAFNTNQNNAACPIGNWILMTSGAAIGLMWRISNATAGGVMSVVDAPSILPAIGDTYVIIKAEVSLVGVSAGTVLAGIDVRTLPTTSQTDAAVGYTSHSFTGVDPLMVDDTRTLATWDATQGGPGTEEHACALIFATPTLARTSLAPYIRQGYMPTAAAYITGGHDGGTIGAVPYVAQGGTDGSWLINTRRRR